MKSISIFIYINLIFAALFSLSNICFAIDVSCLAFIISLVYSTFIFYFLWFHILKNERTEKIFAARKLLQYEPYVFLLAFIARRSGEKGTSFVFDVFSVIFWLAVFISSLYLQHLFEPKKYNSISDKKIENVKNESFAKMFSKGKTRNGKKAGAADYVKWFLFEILDWVDALVQAVFMVLLFQIFFFQFYKIPSESMVPEYMINDRVAVSKITSGPKFPLSDVGLPCIKKYKRGDIVVFRNPHYVIDRNSEVKTVISQIVYMLTFTIVNTNLDENGQIKADPLVKRITGVPGEQLMMQDGILYSRTEGQKEFLPVTEDLKWASYNLNEENEELKKYIRDYKVSDEIYSELVQIENTRNAIDLNKAEDECRQIAESFRNYVYRKSTDIPENEIKKMFTESDLFEYMLCRDYAGFTQKLITVENGARWFSYFMTDWCSKYKDLQDGNIIGDSLYDDANYKLNVMFKISLGKLFLKTAQNIYSEKPVASWSSDAELIEYENSIRKLHNYICFMDRRNMPVFPKNDQNGNPQYIPNDCYFMMGDNRFNSFDMRHTDAESLIKLTSLDDYSITYYSNIKPMYVPKKLILGSAKIRFWPLNRPVRNPR